VLGCANTPCTRSFPAIAGAISDVTICGSGPVAQSVEQRIEKNPRNGKSQRLWQVQHGAKPVLHTLCYSAALVKKSPQLEIISHTGLAVDR